MIAGASFPPRPRTLLHLVPAAREARLRQAYGAQMAWLIAAQLHAQSGAGEFAVPDFMTLFPPPEERRAHASAASVRRSILRMLTRKE